MKIDLDIFSSLKGAVVTETKAFFDQTTRTEEFIFLFNAGEILFIRSSAELENTAILCNSIDELAGKVKNIDHVVKWYEERKKRKYDSIRILFNVVIDIHPYI